MCSVFKFLCILSLSIANIANGIRIANVIKSKHNLAFGAPLSIQKDNLRSGGIFETFLSNLFDLLIDGIPARKLIRYCRVLNRCLRDMEFKYTQQLAKHMRYLSRMYDDDVKAEIEDYKKTLNEHTPMRIQFLEAMNEVFTLREKMLFNDYLFDLRDYGNEDKPFIGDETKKLLDMIVESVFKLSESDRKELLRKLRKAIKEYRLS